MPYAFVQAIQGTVGQSGATSTVTITATAGNLLVLGSRQTGEFRDVTGITDDKGGTWASAATNRVGNSSARDLWYCQNAIGGVTVITVTYDAATTVTCPMVLEYSGLKTTGALEGGASVGTAGVAASTLTTPTITPTSGANYLMVVFGHLEATRTLDAFSGYTSRAYYTDTTLQSRWADKRLTSDAAVSATATLTGGTGFYTIHAAVFEEVVVGPTITVQPVADVGIISNGQSTVYTGTATGTTISAFTWEVGGTPIADGGIYSIVTTGIGTGSASSTLTITRTAKVGTPFNINFDVTDANGTTASNTVTDTWWTGPVLTTFPATNGSGVSTATLTCDYVTGVGEFVEVRIPLSDGDVAVTVTTT